MKTPRLFLLLAWALFAPVAHAAGYPTWTVENQSSREWPDVGFQVGKDWRTLRCRIAECNPHNKKGIVNLYQLVQVGAPSPIKATWTVVKQRNSWSPARLVGSTEYREEEEIDAVLMTYSAELSYYKLDLNTNPITVVQGTNRYPATTSVDRVEVSAPGNAIRVVPPSKMSDDEVKPKPPAAAPGTAPVTAPVTAPATPPKPKTTWWCNKQTGEFIGVKPGHRAPEGYTQLDSHSSTCKAAAGPTNPSQDVVTGWKDVVTPLTAWRQVTTTTKVVLYCYNPALTATDTLLSVANKPGPRSICVSWNVPSPDPVVDGYKARNFSGSYGALSVREGKLRVGTIPMKLFFMTMPSLDFGEVTEAPLDATAFEGATKVKVGDPQKPAAASTELSKKEITWLTKSQASEPTFPSFLACSA